MKFKPFFFTIILLAGLITASASDGNIDFIQNKHQFPDQVLFKADLPAGAVFLTQNGFTYSYYKESDLEHIHDLMHERKEVAQQPVSFHAYQVLFSKANKNASVTQEGLQPYYNNYFIGKDASKWADRVPLYKKIIWHNIYTDIDAVVYSKGVSLKYDFVVRPDGNASQIALTYKGVQPQIKPDGSLQIQTSVNTVSEQAPYAFQLIGGKEIKVLCRFAQNAEGDIVFEFPQGYNKKETLIIDPVLVFGSFSGSTAMTFGFSATYDNNGHFYSGGECFGVGWPYTLGAFQSTFGGNVDAGINKFSSDGTTRLFATYYGGGSIDLPNNLMVNSQGQLLLCGSTLSANLPTTPGCFNSNYTNLYDMYIARFSEDGTQLKAATYIGGNADDGNNTGSLSPNYGDNNRGEVFATPNGNIYITNSSMSANYPVTGNAYQPLNAGAQDAVISELDSNLTTLIYSTYLGGAANDAAFSLVINSSNQMVICGGTNSANFPTTAGAYKTIQQGGTDAFVSILNNTGSLVHSTYLGTSSFDHAFKVQKDELDDILVLGQTDNNSGYPVTAGVYSVPNGSIFIDKLTPTLSGSLASTTMNGFVPTAFMYDICGNTYFSGFYSSSSSPLTANAYQTTAGSFWFGVLGPNFTSLLYSTYFGGSLSHVDGGSSRFDPAGIVYQAVCTNDPNFPTTSNSVSPVKLSPSWDIMSFKFDMGVGAVDANFDLANNAPDTGCSDYHVQFENLSSGAANYLWSFGDGDTSTAFSPDHTFTEGAHVVTLIASRATGCHLIDTASLVIYAKPFIKPLIHLRDTFLCNAVPIVLSANVSNPNPEFHYHWEPASAIISPPNATEVMVNTSLSNVFNLYVDNTSLGECVDTSMGAVHISLNDYSAMIATPADTSICPGDTITMRAFGGVTVLWSPNERVEDATAFTTMAWPEKSRVYSAKITNDSGCSVSRDVHVELFPPIDLFAGNDQDIKRGESTTILAHAAGSFYWLPAGLINPPNSLSPVVSPDKTTTYYLYSTSTEGCNHMDSVTINVTDAMLPNAFSPNGDGMNDVFQLTVFDERVHLKDFSVYNRYGQRVFYTKNILSGWDGTYNNTKCDLNTYFYLVKYAIGDKIYTLKGDVTLIR